jgi:uncharacterized protein (TIGR03435 family)
MRYAWILAALISVAYDVNDCRAQSPETAQSQFDVASIKPSQFVLAGDSNPESIDVSQGGRLTMRNIRLSSCLKWAYGVQDSQIPGPDWVGMDRYDIVALASDPASEEDLKLMLRSLLADRFKLKLHHANKEIGRYGLVVAKNGPKFRESKEEGKSNITRTAIGVTAEKISMPEFADLLSDRLTTPVVDMTGLKGRFDLTFDLREYVANATTPVAVSSLIVEAMEEQLGLKLQATKSSVDVLIIDHIDRPSAN